MRIAKVVFDLPLEEPFDYLIPEDLIVLVGMRVKVSLGTRPMVGFVVRLEPHTTVANLKAIKAIKDPVSLFDGKDLNFARRFANYYGCSLGEALGVMLRHRRQPPRPALIPTAPAISPSTHLYHCPDGNYTPILNDLTRGRTDYFILVPDAFLPESLSLSAEQRARTGLRSQMFEAFAREPFIIMVDEDNGLYKQEQSPRYETRQLVLMAQAVYGFKVAFIGATPSVEVMQAVKEGAAGYTLAVAPALPKPMIVDLSQYKFIEKGILSPPVRSALQANLQAAKQTIIVLNRKGSFSVTRCSGCGHILKCPRCDCAITYVRRAKEFQCRHCTAHLKEAGECPECGKPSWRSYGFGVEHIQKELAGLFPTARIASFVREDKAIPPAFEVLIATQVVLRFKGRLKAEHIVVADIDATLSRADMRSSFRAWSLAMHARCLARHLIVQTRNPTHHAISALAADDAGLFYAEEMRLRRELKFSPFFHWVAVVARAKVEKTAQSVINDVYNILLKNKAEAISLTTSEPDIPAKVRDRYRFRVMAGATAVLPLMALIKQTLQEVKNRSAVIVTVNLDP